MKLLIIRHGDPDYEHDTLTERGWQEARLLAKRLAPLDIRDIYVSPLGRARDTASCTLKAMNRSATAVCDWLREFPAVLEFKKNPALMAAHPHMRQHEDGSYYTDHVWDLMPAYWTGHEDLYDRNRWQESEICSISDIKDCYRRVTEGFDALLAEHGYVRQGNLYRVTAPNTDTLAFFCHFGLACVLLSHLWSVSPFPLWHGMVFAPTSVTTVCTEEREKGIASFRASQLGDVSHLYAAGQEPSFSARFCEVYDDPSQRH